MNKNINIVASVPYNGKYHSGDFIGVDKGSAYLLDKEIDMVLAIGDFDSIAPEEFEKLKKTNVEIVELDAHKDFTDLECAIHQAKSLPYENIYIYGALGQRVDHTLININLLKKHRDVVFYDDTSVIQVVKSGIHHLNEANKVYEYYSFFSIEDETVISLEGFEYPLEDYKLKSDDTLCVSNKKTHQSVIKTNKDIIMIASR